MINIGLVILVLLIMVGLFLVWYRKKHYDEYVKRKEGDHRRFNERKGWRW